MKLLSLILGMTRPQAIGLGWFVGVFIVLAIVGCWCKIKNLIHHETPMPEELAPDKKEDVSEPAETTNV